MSQSIVAGFRALILILMIPGCGMSRTAEIRVLAAEVRAIYGLPPDTLAGLYTTFGEVVPDSILPDSVVDLLQPVRSLVKDERWLIGKNVAGVPFQAHIVGLRRGNGKEEVAFVYYGGRLQRLDHPEYLTGMERMEPGTEPANILDRAV